MKRKCAEMSDEPSDVPSDVRVRVTWNEQTATFVANRKVSVYELSCEIEEAMGIPIRNQWLFSESTHEPLPVSSKVPAASLLATDTDTDTDADVEEWRLLVIHWSDADLLSQYTALFQQTREDADVTFDTFDAMVRKMNMTSVCAPYLSYLKFHENLLVTIRFRDALVKPVLSLPDKMCLQFLCNLDCAKNDLDVLPDLSSLSSLGTLDCAYNRLTRLPKLPAYQSLQILKCECNQLEKELDLSRCPHLIVLNFAENSIQEVRGMSCLAQLRYLYCAHNNLEELPDLKRLEYLVSLHCGGNSHLRCIPGLESMTSLQTLDCNACNIRHVNGLDKLHSLRELSCGENRIARLPCLSALQQLLLLCCGSNELRHVLDVSGLHRLQDLNCSANHLQRLKGLSQLRKLRFLNVSHNCALTFPDESLSELPFLRNVLARNVGGTPYSEDVWDALPVGCTVHM